MNGDTSCAPLKLNTVSTKITNPNTIHSSYNINITPERFNGKFDIRNINEQWLINLSNAKVSNKALVLLQLGQQFNLPNNVVSKDGITREFIKHVEYNLFRADDEIRKNVRE